MDHVQSECLRRVCPRCNRHGHTALQCQTYPEAIAVFPAVESKPPTVAFTARLRAGKSWVCDSGASMHMTASFEGIYDFVESANDAVKEATGDPL